MLDKLNPKLVCALFLVSLCVYIFFAGGHYGGDAINNYLTTKSIVERGALGISKQAFSIEEVKVEVVGVPGRKEGKTYSAYGLGMPLLMVPLYLIGLLLAKLMPQFSPDYITFFTTSFTNTVTSAINLSLIYLITRELGAKIRAAASLAFIYGFSTIAVVYSKVGFAEPAMIMFMLTAFYLLLLNRKAPHSLKVFLAGAACGSMFFIRIYSVIMLPCFFLYLLMVSGRKKADLILFSICPFFLLATVLGLNYYQFGGVLRTGYGALSTSIRHNNRPMKGLYYYLFSTGKGVFFYNPVLLASAFCIIGFLRKRRAEGIFIVSSLIVNAIFFLNMFLRGSIFSWGPRYIFPLVPLMMILLIEGLATMRKKLTVLTLAIIGLLVQIPALFINFSRYIYFVKERLGLDEYMINFIPDLSPIRGTWMLFLSWISRIFNGSSLDFIYAPDPNLVKPIAASLRGYDFADLWFLNVIKVHPAGSGLVKIALLFLGVLFIASAAAFLRMCKGYAREDRS